MNKSSNRLNHFDAASAIGGLAYGGVALRDALNVNVFGNAAATNWVVKDASLYAVTHASVGAGLLIPGAFIGMLAIHSAYNIVAGLVTKNPQQTKQGLIGLAVSTAAAVGLGALATFAPAVVVASTGVLMAGMFGALLGGPLLVLPLMALHGLFKGVQHVMRPSRGDPKEQPAEPKGLTH